MIPVIYRKADYLKTLQYVLGKEEAEVIDTNLGGSKVSEFNKQFLVNKSIKPDIKKPCAHLILSIANNDAVHESLSDEQWASVAKRYLQELEYLPKEQDGVPSQYVAVRHRDREHEHVHIIASQIRFDGTKVNDSFDYFKAQTATRLIAHEMGLEVTPTSSKAVSNKLKTEYGIDADVSDNRSKSIRSVKYKGNEVAAKDVIKNVLFEAIDKSNNMSEFLNNIESKEVYPIIKLDKERQILGFAYTHKGVTMAANQVNKNLSWGRFKNSLKFDIERSDLRLILSSKRKALADISKYKNKPNSDSGGDNSNPQSMVTAQVKDSKKKSYVSVVPSVKDVFPSPSKKSKKSKPTENSKPTEEKTVALEDNKKSYVSVVPSVEDVFPSPTKQNNNASEDEKFKTTQPSNVVEPIPQVTSPDNNISIERVGDAVRTVAAYMAFVGKTQIDGDTLSARLDDNSLVIKDIQSEDTLVEAEYSTRTNQWDIKQSELLTETHLKRIAKLQEKLPRYKIQVENNRSGQER